MLVVIPARSGSTRIPNKTLRRLGQHPLLAYTIASALELHDTRVVVAAEDDIILDCADHYGADTWRRPMATATDDAPDLTWLTLFVDQKLGEERAFMLRRLTSPFVRTSTLERAWCDFQSVPDATAMRAMRLASEHPFKLWSRCGAWVKPAFAPHHDGYGIEDVELWSTPTQLLPRVYVQTAGLEILKAETIRAGSLTGDRVLPWFFSDEQGLDINTANDWWMAEQLIAADAATLPTVPRDPWVQHV